MEIWGYLKKAFDNGVPRYHPLTVACMSIFVLIGPMWTHFQNFLGQNDLNSVKMHAAFHPDKRPSARAKRAVSSNLQPHAVSRNFDRKGGGQQQSCGISVWARLWGRNSPRQRQAEAFSADG